jgi:FlaA1/EpsC-like NDP-sugar epimerase
VASAIGPNCEQRVTGVRPGEKIHEEMITASDSFNTVDLGKYYAILPSGGNYSIEEYCAKSNGKLVTPGFAYDSGSNPNFLSVEQLRALIHEHVISDSPI